MELTFSEHPLVPGSVLGACSHHAPSPPGMECASPHVTQVSLQPSSCSGACGPCRESAPAQSGEVCAVGTELDGGVHWVDGATQAPREQQGPRLTY